MKTLVRKNMISCNKCHAKTRKRCLGTSGLRISSASAATLFMPRHARELRQYISSLPKHLASINIINSNMSAEADVKLEDFKSIFSLSQKVAVVTGGSRGLGLHAASG